MTMGNDMMENSNGMETDAFYAEREKERDELAALRARLAEVERSALKCNADGWLADGNGTVYAPKSMLDEYATRLSVAEIHLAEVERDRDEARRMLTAHNCVCDDPPRCPVFDERDDARRVAKRLALLFRGPKRLGDSVFEDWREFDATVATALAYEVEP